MRLSTNTLHFVVVVVAAVFYVNVVVVNVVFVVVVVVVNVVFVVNAVVVVFSINVLLFFVFFL